MKIKDAIALLNEYENKEQEIMLAWNDIEVMDTANQAVWSKAVSIYEDSSLEGFGDDCRWAIQEAESEEN
jgi:hypothetical protein